VYLKQTASVCGVFPHKGYMHITAFYANIARRRDRSETGATPGQERHSDSSLDYIDWMQPFEARVTEISICSHSVWHYRCSVDVSYATMNEKFSWELVHCCVNYVTEQATTAVSPLRTRVFILPWITGQLFVCLKLFANGSYLSDWDSKFDVLWKSIASKIIQSDMNNIFF